MNPAPAPGTMVRRRSLACFGPLRGPMDALHDTLPHASPPLAEIVIRPVESVDEYRECERLQARIWGPDDVARVPLLDLVTAQENGGLVIGAFGERGVLIGFVHSFPGLTPAGELKQCSIVLAVDSDHQSAGIGFRLKHAQRQASLALGMNLITWTFDPLQSRNAYFNLHKLGVTASVYLVNLYGAQGGLNAGLDTDRLLAEWRLDSVDLQPRAAATTRVIKDGQGLPVVNDVVRHPASLLPVNRRYELDLFARWIQVQIPRNIDEVKRNDIGLARAWRLETREIFLHYLRRGYVVRGFDAGESGDLASYTLEAPAG